METEHKNLTIPETAAALRVKESTIRSWLFDGRLPAIRMGRLVFVPTEAVKKAQIEGINSKSGKVL